MLQRFESLGETGVNQSSQYCSSDQKLIFTFNAKSILLIITYEKINRRNNSFRKTNSR